MHANVHYAVGVIIGSLAVHFLGINLFEFCLVVFFAFGVDFDFIFGKYAKDGNHRNFFTHTIYPPLLIFILGIIWTALNLPLVPPIIEKYPVIFLCAFAYISHLLLDMLDWGLNLFYTDKVMGLFLLITPDEKNLTGFYTDKRNVIKYIFKLAKKDRWFFVRRYYGTPIITVIDIIISLLGFFILFTFAPIFWWIYIGFFLLMEYHLSAKRKADRTPAPPLSPFDITAEESANGTETDRL